MILVDTNVLIYAADRSSQYSKWARETLADAVTGTGAAINTVVLAEVCVGDLEPATAADRIRSWGIQILDLPVAVAPVGAAAYRLYRRRRTEEAGRQAPRLPLPDFLIGAHAEVMGCPLATADPGRFRTYFPSVALRTP